MHRLVEAGPTAGWSYDSYNTIAMTAIIATNYSYNSYIAINYSYNWVAPLIEPTEPV